MAKLKINPGAKPISIVKKGKNAFILIHGYTGSPTDFNRLSKFLKDRSNASVYVPLLPGHGTKVSDLDGIHWIDFYNHVEKTLKKLIDEDKNVIIIGHSTGGLIGLLLAADYPVKGVVVSAAPYEVKFPFTWRRVIKFLAIFKKYWKKRIDELESQFREESFYYKEMHSSIVSILSTLKFEVNRHIQNIKCPSLFIYSNDEGLVDVISMERMKEKIGSSVKKGLVYPSSHHNLFFSEYKDKVYQEILEFADSYCFSKGKNNN